MSYQTAISGLDWQMVPSGMIVPPAGIAAMQLYEQGMGAIVAGNNVGYINANIAGGNYNGTINDVVYDTIIISGAINANRTVNLYFNSGTQNGVKRYTVILASNASSGGPYTVTLTTGTGSTVVVPIPASGDTVYSNPLVFMLYVDPSGNVIDGTWKISGSNSNGSYIQFDDGTMEEWGVKALTAFPTALTFPVSFANNAYSWAAVYASSSVMIGYASKIAASIGIYATQYNNSQISAGNVDWIAQGRWK